MNVTIVGAGNMGRGIGCRVVTGGHSLTLMDKELQKAERLAAELQEVAKEGATVRAVPFGPANVDGEVVFLAVRYPATLDLVRELGSQLTCRIVVDIANPLNDAYDALVTSPETSAAEEVAKVAPPGAAVVKAFNTTFAGTLVKGQVAGQMLDVFIAGDSDEAKAKVSQLVLDGQLRPIDVGPLQRARQLEALGLLAITLQGRYHLGFRSAWKLVS